MGGRKIKKRTGSTLWSFRLELMRIIASPVVGGPNYKDNGRRARARERRRKRDRGFTARFRSHANQKPDLRLMRRRSAD
jgi:hypothetical protein